MFLLASTHPRLRVNIARAPALVYDFLSLAVPPGRPQNIERVLFGLSRSQFHRFWLGEEPTRRSLITNISRIIGGLESALATPEGTALGLAVEDLFHAETLPGKERIYTVKVRSIREHEPKENR